MPITQQDISNVIKSAEQLIIESKNSLSSGKSQSLKDTIYQYSQDVQKVLNGVLSKTGVITDEEINKLEEQVRMAKKNIMLAQAQETKKRINTTLILLATGFVALWFITKNKAK